MKKVLSFSLPFIFFQLITVNIFSSGISPQDFALDRALSQNEITTNSVFSLKEDYTPGIKAAAEYFSESVTMMQQVMSRDDELRAEISELKKKRTTSYAVTGVLAVLAGFFLYKAITFEEGERETQIGETGKSGIKSAGRIIWVSGTLLCAGISVFLMGNAKRYGREIKSREEELKKLSAAQAKLESR